ncbi:HAD family phosphatase [Tabrizicola sp. KVB23]|uniref:HAD family phosphatase n=2 Tax=Fuscibacter oryzae TaxID=2803939 RepID=A0A8J7ST03_9RHOB|nr:HAD family phosphatase [Fuscibacter oryzae]
MDGCLVDSEPLSLEAVAAEIRASGLPDVTATEVGGKYLGVSLSQIVRDVESRLGHPCPPGFTDRMEERLFASYSAGLPQIDGVEGLLAVLDKAGIAVAIASGASVRRLARTLDHAGLAGYFEGRRFSADQVRHGKPAPDVFLLAARELGVEPRHCAVLEDSPHGIRGAVAAGMRAVGFVGGSHLAGLRKEHAAILREAGADQVIDTLSQAFDALIPQEFQRGAR